MHEPVSIGWPAVVAFAAIAWGAGLVGVWLMWRHEPWARRHTGELITFASGLLVAGSLLHLLARAGELAGTGSAMLWGLAAFVGLYVAENHYFPHPHSRSDHGERGHAGEDRGSGGAEGSGRKVSDAEAPLGRAAGAVLLGLTLHSVLDGVAAGAGFSVSLLTGGVILSLVVAHKLPVGIASMGVLYHGGTDRRRAFRYSLGVAGVTPAAILVSFALLRGAPVQVIGAFVAAAGGSFLYVGAADLLPEGQASGRAGSTLAFLLGVAVMVLVVLLAPPEGGA
ncbi:MAG: ZIP family metal transporter [Gemmatimonadota bacterium]